MQWPALCRSFQEGSYSLKPTNVLYKLLPSVINVSATFMLALPLAAIDGFGTAWKLTWLGTFLLYCLVSELFFGRDLGMKLCGTVYERPRTVSQKAVYAVLYTLSFSSVVFYVWFPFDLLIANLLFVQLPAVYLTGNTAHGYISGNVRTVRSS